MKKKITFKKKTYSEDFKKNAIVEVKGGKTMRSVAKKLGVNINSLRAWLGKGKKGKKVMMKKVNSITPTIASVIESAPVVKSNNNVVSLLEKEILKLQNKINSIQSTIDCLK